MATMRRWRGSKVFDANGTEIPEDYLSESGMPHIGHQNPFRYRGYFYDANTKLYYLESRFYDPETGRFLNADTVEYLDPESINGLNLYAYCGNNPVMNVDPTGHFLISTSIAIGFWIGFSIGVIAGGIAGGIIAYNIAKNHGSTGWQLLGWTLLGVLGGGFLGGVVGGTIGALAGYGVGMLFGTAPVAGSNGAITLWSGEAAKLAATNFAKTSGTKILSNTFVAKTLTFAQHFIPKPIMGILWGTVSAEFVSAATSATIFLLDAGIKYDSVFFQYEIWELIGKGIERTINFVK